MVNALMVLALLLRVWSTEMSRFHIPKKLFSKVTEYSSKFKGVRYVHIVRSVNGN